MAILKENKEANATTKPRSAKTNPVTPKKIEVKATNVGETLPEKNTDSDSNLNLAELKVAVKDISGLPARTVEVAKKIQSLGEELDELLMKEPEINKGNADLYKSLDSRASKLRTSLENERKLYVGPFNSTVAVINAMFKKFNTDIKDGIELVLEPSLKVWNKAEEERLEKARQEKERAFTERIDTLMALGAELDKEAGRYVIKSPDGNADNNMSFHHLYFSIPQH